MPPADRIAEVVGVLPFPTGTGGDGLPGTVGKRKLQGQREAVFFTTRLHGEHIFTLPEKAGHIVPFRDRAAVPDRAEGADRRRGAVQEHPVFQEAPGQQPVVFMLHLHPGGPQISMWIGGDGQDRFRNRSVYGKTFAAKGVADSSDIVHHPMLPEV